jgi:uncharacterized protein
VRTVEEYIDSLPDEQQRIITLIRNLILAEVPGIEERFSFKIPFYHYFGMFMYLNAVPGGIDIGFCRGKDLQMAFPQLETKGRAIVASLLIGHEKEIIQKNLRTLIIAAAAWNEEAKRNGIPMVAGAKKKSLPVKKGIRSKRS